MLLAWSCLPGYPARPLSQPAEGADRPKPGPEARSRLPRFPDGRRAERAAPVGRAGGPERSRRPNFRGIILSAARFGRHVSAVEQQSGSPLSRLAARPSIMSVPGFCFLRRPRPRGPTRYPVTLPAEAPHGVNVNLPRPARPHPAGGPPSARENGGCSGSARVEPHA